MITIIFIIAINIAAITIIIDQTISIGLYLELCIIMIMIINYGLWLCL